MNSILLLLYTFYLSKFSLKMLEISVKYERSLGENALLSLPQNAGELASLLKFFPF